MEGLYVCQLIDEATNQCMHWVPFSIIPYLTDEARDVLLLICISSFISIMIVQFIKRLMIKGD